MSACLTLEPKKSNPKKYFLNGIGTKKHVPKNLFSTFLSSYIKTWPILGLILAKRDTFLKKRLIWITES